MRNVLPALLALLVCLIVAPVEAAAPTGQTVTLNLDYFDIVALLGIWDLDHVEEEMARMMADSAAGGVDRILYRISVCGEVAYRSKEMTTFNGDPRREHNPEGNLGKGFECDRLKVVLDKIDPLEVAVREAHKHGLPLYAWITLYDSYAPNLEDEFFEAHPELWLQSRDGKSFVRGAPCYAEPQVREHRLAQVREILKYGVDGFFFSTRSHASWPPDAARDYGYNPPVVAEYKKRYGKDPRRTRPGSLEELRFVKLKGEFLTGWMRQVRQVTGNLPLAIALSSATADPTRANRMFVDADELVRHGLVDEICMLDWPDVATVFHYKLLTDRPLKVTAWRNVWAWGEADTDPPRTYYPPRIKHFIYQMLDLPPLDGICLHEQLHFEAFDLYPVILDSYRQWEKEIGAALPAKIAVIDDDVQPANGAAERFARGGGGCALDYRRRSIVLAFDAPRRVTQLTLTASEAKAWPTPVTRETLSIWTSNDNRTYSPYQGPWRYSVRRNEAGHVIIELSGLDLKAKYLKVHCNREGTAFKFSNSRLEALVRAYGPD